MPKLAALLLIVVILPSLSLAGGSDPSYSPYAVVDTVPFYADADYDANLPNPNDYTQFPIGQWPLRYHELQNFLEAITTASPKLTMEIHGHTYEGRPLYNVFIASEENIRKLDQIQQAMTRLGEPSEGATQDEIDSLVQSLPAVAWLGYSIHGDEVSGVDAAAHLIYHFAAGRDTLTTRLLDNLVIIVDPSQNPDGRERYLSMLQSYRSHVPNYNRFSLQHRGVWPWGRWNHYMFDLNRDWILVRQQETKGRLATILKWHPQLAVDAHEMGSNATYLFSPPRQPINYNTPDHVMKWMDIFGADQAEAFDRRAWPYYTGEWDEQWYPGYGAAWPSFTGAVGILYEMAGVDGQFVKQRDDYLLSYHEAVNKQFTSSLANLTTLADNREVILKEYHEARKKIVADGRRSNEAFIIKPDKDETKLNRFVESLLNQGIEVQRATGSFTVGSAINTFGEAKSSIRFPAGSYVVSMAQAQGAVARAALDFDPRLKLKFLEEERREIEKHNDTRLYEVSTWSVPLAYDLDAYKTTSSLSVSTEAVTAVVPSEGKLFEANAQFGFVVDMVGEKTNMLLARLFEEDVVIYASQKPFTLETRQYAPGSLVLRRRGNPDNLPEILSRLAGEIGINIYGVGTGESSEGSKLGAPTFRLLKKPRVAILTGNAINVTAFGPYWYTIDLELNLPHSLMNLNNLSRADFSQFNVLVLPSSWGDIYPKLGKSGKTKIAEWVKDGGTLICESQSAVWATDTANGISKVRTRRQALDKLDDYSVHVSRERGAEKPVVDTMALFHPEKVTKEESEDKKPSLKLDELKDLDKWQRKFVPRGVMLRVDLDTEHWLSFGMENRVPALLYFDHAFLSKSPVTTVGRFADHNDLRVSGLLWPEARERLANSAYLTRETSGKGQIIIFAANPNIRAYNYGTRQLLVNALLYGPGMGSSFEGPYNEQEF